MKPKIDQVIPLDDFFLLLKYSSSEERIFDMKPWLEKGMFQALQDYNLFRLVKPFRNAVEWPNGADLDPETLCSDSIPVIIN